MNNTDLAESSGASWFEAFLPAEVEVVRIQDAPREAHTFTHAVIFIQPGKERNKSWSQTPSHSCSACCKGRHSWGGDTNGWDHKFVTGDGSMTSFVSPASLPCYLSSHHEKPRNRALPTMSATQFTSTLEISAN